MSSKPKLSLDVTDTGREPIMLLREAIGEHYDVRREEEDVVIADEVIHEPVIRIYDKGGTVPRLSLWLSR